MYDSELEYCSVQIKELDALISFSMFVKSENALAEIKLPQQLGKLCPPLCDTRSNMLAE